MKRNLLPMGVVIALLLALPSLPVTVRAAQQERPEPPKIIRKSGSVLQGSATRRVAPTYPPLAKTARVSGTVVVEVTVDEEGKVTAARPLSGHPLLKTAAVDAARGWEFTPTQLSGVPVKVIGTITFNFNLDTKADIERFKQQIAERPNDPDLYYALGAAYGEIMRDEEALGAFHQALALKSDFTEAWMAAGRIYVRMHRDNDAIEAYRQAAQTASDAPEFRSEALKETAKIYFGEQRYQEAVEAYKQALAADEVHFDPTNYIQLAEAYLRLGDKESALEQCRKLRESNPSLAEQLLKQINGQQ